MFQRARLNLTSWYLLIIMLISIIFSLVIYAVINQEYSRIEKIQKNRQERIQHGINPLFKQFRLERQRQGQNIPPIPSFEDPQMIIEARNRLLAMLSLANLGIFVIAGISGYFLSGRTLKPIKEMIDEQNRFITDAVARGLATNDPTYIEENAAWLQTEADYQNQALVVSAAESSLASASLNLSQLSSTITAPVSGTVKGLTITSGAIVTTSSSSSSSTSTSQVLGSIYQEGPIQALVNISEIDSVNVAEGQKATLTLDAFPDSTFTGKVVSINTNGVVSSNVTSYPAVISFDFGNDHIYPNMGVAAKIITKITDNVLLIPNSAIQSANGQKSVRVMKNGSPTTVSVETGSSNDTQTEITSGLNEGDEVITGSINSASSPSNRSSSVFSPRGLGGFGGR